MDHQLVEFLILNRDLFARVFSKAHRFSSRSIFGMIYEHLRDCFSPEDPSSRFFELYRVVEHVAQGRIPVRIARALGASRLLAIAKDTDEIRPIAIGEVFLHLISRTLVLQLRVPF